MKPLSEISAWSCGHSDPDASSVLNEAFYIWEIIIEVTLTKTSALVPTNII